MYDSVPRVLRCRRDQTISHAHISACTAAAPQQLYLSCWAALGAVVILIRPRANSGNPTFPIGPCLDYCNRSAYIPIERFTIIVDAVAIWAVLTSRSCTSPLAQHIG